MDKIFDSIADLPDSVRDRLTTTEQRVWLRIFNSVFRRTEGSTQDKEAAAFRQANGVLARMQQEKSMEKFQLRVALEKSTINDEQHLVWGYAYVCEEDGVFNVDHSGDGIDIAELQKAAHGFIAHSRTGNVMHESEGGSIVEAIVFTPELNTLLQKSDGKCGLFICFHVADEAVWVKVKDGTLSMFSIGGTADTQDVTDAAA